MNEDDPIVGVLRKMLEEDGRPLVLRDLASGKDTKLTADVAVAPNGGLPALLAAGEAIWKAAMGSGFGLEVEADTDALFGFRVAGVDEGERMVAMLATMVAVQEACRQDMILVNDVNRVYRDYSHVAKAHEHRPRGSPSP